MPPILSIKNLQKEFFSRGNRVLAVEDLSLDIEDGEFITIVGPSGCGKSTLLNCIIGLVHPTSGTITYKDKKLHGINTDIGYVPQSDYLYAWRTLINNVAFPLEMRGVDQKTRHDKARELIQRVGSGRVRGSLPP